MGTHKVPAELQRETEAAKSKVSVGALYWHYKSKELAYKVVGLGFLEATDELCVIYQAQYKGKRHLYGL